MMMQRGMKRCLTLTAALAVVLVTLIGNRAWAVTNFTHTLGDATSGNSVELVITSGSDRAGDEASVVLLTIEADARNPQDDDVVYVNQVRLDEQGSTTVTVNLPSDDLTQYQVAVASTSGGERYIAPLLGTDTIERPIPTSEPTEPGADEPGTEPTDDPTDEPGDEPGDQISDPVTPVPAEPDDQPTTQPETTATEPATPSTPSDPASDPSPDGTPADAGTPPWNRPGLPLAGAEGLALSGTLLLVGLGSALAFVLVRRRRADA